MEREGRWCSASPAACFGIKWSRRWAHAPGPRNVSTHTHPATARPDFGFDDEERDKYLGGYIAAAFYMVGAPAALLFGYLSDTVNRRNLLFAAVLLGGWRTQGWGALLAVRQKIPL